MATGSYTPTIGAVVHKVVVYLDDRPTPGVVHLSQGDNGPLGIIAAELYSNSKKYTVPAGATVRIRVKKPDGTEVYYDSLGLDSRRELAYFEVTEQMSAAAGEGVAIIEVSTPAGVVGSAYMVMSVDKNPIAPIIESLGQYKSLEDLLAQITAITDKAEAVVNTDKTLSISGAPADANAVGNELSKCLRYRGSVDSLGYTSFSDITTTGIYYVTQPFHLSAKDAPVGIDIHATFLIVIQRNSNYTAQYFIEDINGGIFTRRYWNGTWTEWCGNGSVSELNPPTSNNRYSDFVMSGSYVFNPAQSGRMGDTPNGAPSNSASILHIYRAGSTTIQTLEYVNGGSYIRYKDEVQSDYGDWVNSVSTMIDGALTYLGDGSLLGSNFSDMTKTGFYGITADFISNADDSPVLPSTRGGVLFVVNAVSRCFQTYMEVQGAGIYLRSGTPSTAFWRDWRPVMQSHITGYVSNTTSLAEYDFDGYFPLIASVINNASDTPIKTSSGGILRVVTWSTGTFYQVLETFDGPIYSRYKTSNGIIHDWVLLNPKSTDKSLYGKTISILGASIETSGNSGATPNACEIEITEADVGKTLSAYLTYNDVQAELSIGGKTFTSEQIGTEVSFVPTKDDVGKKIGLPLNYNSDSLKVWWKYLVDAYGCTVNNVSWSGSGATKNRQGSSNAYVTSEVYHPAQIRKVGIRTPGTMERKAPDYIIINRAVNDFTHAPYAVITNGFFDKVAWGGPDSEMVDDKHGWLEAMSIAIAELRKTYPSSRIVLCTPTNCKRVNNDHYPINNGVNNFTQWVKATHDVADFFGCDVIEMDKCGITFENMYPTYINDSASTPTHPNAAGHEVMGRRAVNDFAKFI